MRKPKSINVRRRVWTMVVSMITMSATAYFWNDITRLAPLVINKVLNRETADKKTDRSLVPAIFTSWNKNVQP